MRYSQETRKKFLLAHLDMASRWGDLFDDKELDSLHYLDLFLGMWLHSDKLLTKTEVQSFMPRLGHQTAAKYINHAVDSGFIAEVENPEDSRSKLLALPKSIVNDVNKLLDKSIDVMKKAL
jgi:hypothetical protein